MKNNDWMVEEVLKILTESTLTPDQAGTSTRNGPYASAGANGPHPVDSQKFKGKLPDEEVKKHDTLSEEAINPGEAAKMVNLFKLQMSENWGKLDTVERQELERVVYTATAGQEEVRGRLTVIQRQMTELREGTLGKIKNPRRILSQIILLETFNRLFKSFQPSPAGFVNEGLLSVFYGSTQEDAGEANKEFQIGDVIATDGSPISIKTKIDGKAKVDGSLKNLYHSLNGSKTGKVYFDIFVKKKDDKETVGSLSYYRFDVDASNINQFLDVDLFEPNPEDPTKVILKKKYRNSNLAEGLLREGIADTKWTAKDFADDTKDISAAKANELYAQVDGDEDKFKELVDDIEKPTTAALIKKWGVKKAKLQDFLDAVLRSSDLTNGGSDPEYAGPNPGYKAVYNKIVVDLATLYNQEFTGKTKPKGKGKKLHTEFGVSQGQWMRFAKAQGNEPPIVLNFDDESIERTIEAAVADIDVAITDMFNGLATFTGTVQTYLTTIADNRAMIGEKATREANELPAKTEKVVDVAGTDPTEDQKG
jgi:hypothetical protein